MDVKYICFFIAAVFSAAGVTTSGWSEATKSGSASGPASVGFVQQLTERYAKARSWHAEIVQIKEAPYLLRPLVSQVTLTVAGAKVRWQVTKPEPFTVEIDGDAISFKEASGKKVDLPVSGTGDHGAASGEFVRVIRALIQGNQTELKKDFKIEYDLPKVILVADDSKNPLKRITLTFSPDLIPKQIDMVLGDETIKLTFQTFVVD